MPAALQMDSNAPSKKVRDLGCAGARFLVSAFLVLSQIPAGCWEGTPDQEGETRPPGLQPEARQEISRRLVILGFDGLDWKRVHRLMEQGKLPHLAALGGYRGPLQSTNPPLSPVAWTTFATGHAPGRHGVVDFVRPPWGTQSGREGEPPQKERELQVGTASPVHAEIAGGILRPSTLRAMLDGRAFWDRVATEGVPSRALWVPYVLPPTNLSPGTKAAVMISGPGLPDVRGHNASFTWFKTENGGQHRPPGGRIAVLRKRGDSWHAMLEGPLLRIDGALERPVVPLRLRREGSSFFLRLGEGTREHGPLGRGESTSYVPLRFQPHARLSIDAWTRFTLLSLEPPELYAQPLGVAPEAPYWPMSHPPDYASRLWRRYGPFNSVGWQHDTAAVEAGLLGLPLFLQRARDEMRFKTRVLRDVLLEEGDRLLVAVYSAPDRAAHLLGREAGDGALLDALYEEVDQQVGGIGQLLGESDALLVLSDHGFTSFERQFDLNRWLFEQGLLRFRKADFSTHAGPSRAIRRRWQEIDWLKSQAYALGAGGIFLNLKGREPFGTVGPEDASRLLKRIAGGLSSVRQQVGTKEVTVVREIYRGDEIFAGPKRFMAPDLRVALVPGYRVAWATAMGGMGPTLFSPNRKRWSADHASADPRDVPGVLFSSHPIAVSRPRIDDIAVTALRFMGMEASKEMLGRNWWPEPSEPRGEKHGR